MSLSEAVTVMRSSTFPTLIMDSSLSSTQATVESVIVFDKSGKLRSQHMEGRSVQHELHKDSSKSNREATRQTVPWDASYSLPPATDERVAFPLTTGGRLSDYKWIGIYNQCNNMSVPLVWLQDVDPPREEEIGAVVALERNISSGERIAEYVAYYITLKNLYITTVPERMLPTIVKKRYTFVFVGVGNVTDTVQQTKARMIGYEFDDPLEQHSGDDVMVRLPRGVRTFDVDFLNIYNEDVKKSYGYVALPSLLVPPCADDL
ncbi:hypothetical protein V3C99_019233 [Haemonchus contortus]|uniref:DM13 domain-containing protein n=1 Tax=Haemonchus contortus TaxID=6289 RepID=A0A7I4YYF7_HAECO